MRTTEGTPLERAIGIEIQTEAKRQGMSHKEIQHRAGINDKTFRRYFVASERHIPFEFLEKVAAAIETPISELTRRAEANLPLLAARDAEAKYRELLGDKSLSEEEKGELRRAIGNHTDDVDDGPPSSTTGTATGT